MQLCRFHGVGGAGLKELARPGCTVWEALHSLKLLSVLVLAGPRRYHTVPRGPVGSLTKVCLFPYLLVSHGGFSHTGHIGSHCPLLPTALSLGLGLLALQKITVQLSCSESEHVGARGGPRAELDRTLGPGV